MSEKQIPHLPYMNRGPAMSEKLSPLQQSVFRKPKPKSLDERYCETVLMGVVAVTVVPAACLLAILAIPFWLIGLVVRPYFKNDFF